MEESAVLYVCNNIFIAFNFPFTLVSSVGILVTNEGEQQILTSQLISMLVHFKHNQLSLYSISFSKQNHQILGDGKK